MSIFVPVAAPWQWAQVASEGQSLGEGFPGPTPLSTVARCGNQKFIDNSGVYNIAGPTSSVNFAMIPLVALVRSPSANTNYPTNISGEDPGTSCSNALAEILLYNRYSPCVTVNTNVAVGGAGIATIGKQNAVGSYFASTWETKCISVLAGNATKTMGRLCTLLVHGETDASLTTYASDVYGDATHGIIFPEQTDVPAQTSQVGSIPCFMFQQNSSPTTAGLTPYSTLQQVSAAATYPGLWFCIGPEYQYPNAPADIRHKTAASYRQMGDLAAWVIYRTHTALANLGAWTPLGPTAFAGSNVNKTWTITFHMPLGGNLQWDTTFTSPHATGSLSAWAGANGFEATDLPGTITNATAASPVVIAQATHGYSNGDTVIVMDVGGVTGANGYFVVANKTANTYELQGSVGGGAYTSGGTASRVCQIASVALSGSNQVIVTLTNTPGVGLAINYAYSIDLTSNGGFGCNRGGLLKDSWAVRGVCTGTLLYNWCVAFTQGGLT